MTEWSVTEPVKLTPAGPVTRLQVRIVNGAVNVVGTDESSVRVEISEIEGPPLIVSQDGSTLTVSYEDLHHQPDAAQTRVTEQIATVERGRIQAAIETCFAETRRQKSKMMAWNVLTAKICYSPER